MDCSTPDLLVHHQLLELTRTHVHWVSDAINNLILCRPLLLPPSISPSIRVFPMSQFSKGGQSIGVSVSISVLPMNIQDWYPLGWTDWISMLFKGLSRVFFTPQFRSINSLALGFLYSPTSHPYMTTAKTITLTRWTFVGKVISLLLNMLSRLVITFLPRNKHL